MPWEHPCAKGSSKFKHLSLYPRLAFSLLTTCEELKRDLSRFQKKFEKLSDSGLYRQRAVSLHAQLYLFLCFCNCTETKHYVFPLKILICEERKWTNKCVTVSCKNLQVATYISFVSWIIMNSQYLNRLAIYLSKVQGMGCLCVSPK